MVGWLFDILVDIGLDVSIWVVFVIDYGLVFLWVKFILYDVGIGIVLIICLFICWVMVFCVYDEFFSGVDLVLMLLDLLRFEVFVDVEGVLYVLVFFVLDIENVVVCDYVYIVKIYYDLFDLIWVICIKEYSYIENYVFWLLLDLLWDI